MTPKDAYVTRQSARQKLEGLEYQPRKRAERAMMLDIADRIATAAERMADALEASAAAAATVKPAAPQ